MTLATSRSTWQQLLDRLLNRVSRRDMKKWHALLSGKTPDQQLWAVKPPKGALMDARIRRWVEQTLQLGGYDVARDAGGMGNLLAPPGPVMCVRSREQDMRRRIARTGARIMATNVVALTQPTNLSDIQTDGNALDARGRLPALLDALAATRANAVTAFLRLRRRSRRGQGRCRQRFRRRAVREIHGPESRR